MRPTAFLWSIFMLLAPLAPRLVADETVFSRELLGLTNETRRQLAEAARHGLIEIAPVHLPVDPPGDCNHYGWPIATMAGDTIVVMHRRIPGHNPRGAGEPHAKMSYGIVLRSGDGGKTWTKPFDLRDCMQCKQRPENVAPGGEWQIGVKT